MRKSMLMVVAALVLTLAAPGFAAVDFEGKLGSELKIEKNDQTDEWEVIGKTGIELETSIIAGGGNPVKAHIELKPWELYSGEDEDGEPAGFDEDGNPIGPFDRRNDPNFPFFEFFDMEIDKAWIETEGAYWDNGPKVKTRIGDIDVEWDNYVSYLEDRAGVTIEGMEIGPVKASAFYAWHDALRPMGLNVQADIDVVELEGRIIRRDGVGNYLVAAGMEVVPGVHTKGLLAIDGDDNQLYRIEAEADRLIDGFTFKAAYRGADDDFEPMYTRTHDDDDNELYDTRTGVSVGVRTSQAGIDMEAGYDHPKRETSLAAATEMAGYRIAGTTKLVSSSLDEAHVVVGRTFGQFDVTGEYEASIDEDTDELEHIVRVGTRTDMIPYVSDIGFMGQMKFLDGDTTWKAGADYVAPNGISLAAEYDSEDGPSATAGVKVEF